LDFNLCFNSKYTPSACGGDSTSSCHLEFSVVSCLVNLLMYHFVSTVKYRKSLIHKDMENTIKEICLEISKRYEIYFLEIGSDINHIHFLIQSVPTCSPTKIITTVKSILAREIFKIYPEVKKQLWGGEFWTDGYYVNTVSRYGGEKQIQRYIQNQEKNPTKDYKQIFQNKAQNLFEEL